MVDWIKSVRAVLEAAKLSKELYKWFHKTAFLNYDLSFLMNAYPDEHSLGPYVPYSEVASWLDTTVETTETRLRSILIQKLEPHFDLESPTEGLRLFRADAEKALRAKGKMHVDNTVVRLEDAHPSGKGTRLLVRKAWYRHQAGSNLVMDWRGPHSLLAYDGIRTFRDYLKGQYTRHFPRIDDPVLANSVGIAVILLYRSGSNLIPYLPRRVGTDFKDMLKKTGRTGKNVAVFEGGYHCTASGAG